VSEQGKQARNFPILYPLKNPTREGDIDKKNGREKRKIRRAPSFLFFPGSKKGGNELFGEWLYHFHLHLSHQGGGRGKEKEKGQLTFFPYLIGIRRRGGKGKEKRREG